MILQERIPFDVLNPLPLPSLRPITPEEWLYVDDAYGAQMAERRRLIAQRPHDVLAMAPPADEVADAAEEALDLVLNNLSARTDFRVQADEVTGPDGVTTKIDRTEPLASIGGLIQEDICLIMKPEGHAEHILAAAALCFPASWRLDEKIGRPLTAVHAPVPEYTPHAKKVQKLFDVIRVERPLCRFNVLYYDDPALFQPRSAQEPRPLSDPEARPFIRSERQCMVRLPRSGAVIFSIHTFVVRSESVTAAEASSS